MNILLIQPPKAPTVIGGEDLFLYEPLELEYVAAGVSRHHEIKLLDMRFEKDLMACLKEFKPHVVGITACVTQVNTAKKLCKEIKAWNNETLTVVGGHHPTAFPHDFQVEYIDVIVAGEGVFSFKEIVDKYEKGKQSLSEILDNKVYKTELIHEDIDAYPFPRRDLTEKYRSNYFSEWMKPLASMVTSKGCPGRCNFCCLWKMTGGKYLKRKPENIVKEIETIKEQYIFFADAESMVDVKRMMTLANLIKQRGIKKKFYLYSRSDTVVKNPELFKLWREIGLERVFVGFEFYKEKDMGVVKKGSTINDNEYAMKILNDLGISMIASYMIPQDYTKEDFREFLTYCKGLKSRLKLKKSTGFTFSVLTPLPGTDLYEDVKSQLITDNYDLFDLYHSVLPTKLPLEQFYEEFHYLFTKIYTLNDILGLLKHYKLKDIPKNLVSINKMMGRLKTLHKDY